MMRRDPKPRKVRTLRDLKDVFDRGVIDKKYWTVCLDSGGAFLRYIGPNPEGYEPQKPLDLQLTTDPFDLLEEAMNAIGIPAERP